MVIKYVNGILNRIRYGREDLDVGEDDVTYSKGTIERRSEAVKLKAKIKVKYKSKK